MWDSIKESYTESISSVFPIHRILIVLFGFLCATSIEHQNYKSIIETLLRFEFNNFSTDSGKLFEHSSLFDCLWGLILSGFSLVLHQILARIIFIIISKATKYEQRVELQIKQYAWLSKVSTEERNRSIEIVQVEKKNSLAKLTPFSISAELSISIFLSMIVVSYWGNSLDIVISGIALLISIGLHARYVYLFFSTYLGPALQENLLKGKAQSVPFPSSMQ